jgi:hypothetical protein
MYVLPIVHDAICSVIIGHICFFCGVGRPLRVKHRANIGLRVYDLWWRRLAETCSISDLSNSTFCGVLSRYLCHFDTYAAITCLWCILIWYILFVTVITGTYGTLSSWNAPVSPPRGPCWRSQVGATGLSLIHLISQIWQCWRWPTSRREERLFYLDTACNK